MVTGSSHSINICPPHSPTPDYEKLDLEIAGAFYWPNTSRIRFWAFSYSVAEPCGCSNQLIPSFMFFPSFGNGPTDRSVLTYSRGDSVGRTEKAACARIRQVYRIKDKILPG
jgi:hypothetical protein